MCVIIQRDAGVEIPFDKLEIACRINKHGYGLSVADRGKLVTYRSIQDNDPKEIAKRLDDAKKHKVFLHLRHATVGTVDMANSHPFVLARKKDDGTDMGFMHNGTLYKFKPTTGDESDTNRFVHTLVKPLVQYISHKDGPRKVLSNTLLYDILHDYSERSKFIVYDGWGDYTIINEKDGKQFEGWWASNEYSFRETHERAGGRAYESAQTFLGLAKDQDNEEFTPGRAAVGRSGVSNRYGSSIADDYRKRRQAVLSSGVSGEPSNVAAIIEELTKKDREKLEALTVQCNRIKIRLDIVSDANQMANMSIMQNLSKPRKTFKELSGLHNLDELEKFSPDDIEHLMKEFPKGMVACFMDLIGERRISRGR